MYVYEKSEPKLWTVGFYNPEGKWVSESDHDSPEEAVKRVNWLNGKRVSQKPVIWFEGEPKEYRCQCRTELTAGQKYCSKCGAEQNWVGYLKTK